MRKAVRLSGLWLGIVGAAAFCGAYPNSSLEEALVWAGPAVASASYIVAGLVLSGLVRSGRLGRSPAILFLVLATVLSPFISLYSVIFVCKLLPFPMFDGESGMLLLGNFFIMLYIAPVCFVVFSIWVMLAKVAKPVSV
jgi:glucan phosphoethanolaminetransferase (alkaline phosphatase superfamily)